MLTDDNKLMITDGKNNKITIEDEKELIQQPDGIVQEDDITSNDNDN